MQKVLLEKEIVPTKIELEETENGRRLLTVYDQENHSYKFGSTSVYWRFLRFMRKYTGLTDKQMHALEIEELEEIINKALSKNKKKFKVLLYDDGTAANIVSLGHKQIDPEEAKKTIESTLARVFGQFKTEENFKGYVFKIPSPDKRVEYYLFLDLGSNLALGRASIRISTKIRVVTKVGRAPVCHNWAHIWDIPTKWLGIPIEKLPSVERVEGLDKMNFIRMRKIHTKGTKIDPEYLENQLREVKENMKNIKIFLDESVKTELDYDEMEQILQCYVIRGKISKKVKKLIMDVAVKQGEESIWGLSNAVSYVRTHLYTKLNTRAKDPYFAPICQNLELIAGELLVLAPTIRKIKEKVGKLTVEKILGETAKVEGKQ